METRGIVLGLGNPGTRYDRTRHNLGFRAVDRLARIARASWTTEAGGDLEACTAVATIDGGRYILAKPRTFMNRSGSAGKALCRHHEVPVGQMLVIYDDADLALGRIRVRRDGGAGGHNGLRSLIEELGGTDFPRVRLGVRGERRDGVELADYVLEAFGQEEEPIADALVELGAEAAMSVLVSGVTKTMDRFNGRIAVATVGTEEDREQE